MPDPGDAPRTLGDLALEVRSKNAGPFWMTLEAFMPNDETYRIADSLITPELISELYQVAAASLQIFRIPDLHVVKVSFPRPVVQGSLHDRDMHGGQHHVPLANTALRRLSGAWPVASAYIDPMATFSAADIPDMTGRTVIVTGANSGIGRAAAHALAAARAHVVLAVRDPRKGRTAAGAMPGVTEVRQLDLASLDSVRAFASGWQGEISLLINNAGVMVPPLTRTADGFELQFGTNHLGHFALSNLLLPLVTGRVVTVSSTGHRAGRIDFDDLNWQRKPYRAWRAYGQSKLANLLFTSELQRRLTQAGSPVKATAAHPGYAATNLQSHGGSRVVAFAMEQLGNRVLAQDAAGGALPTLYAAVADIPGDSFAGPGFLGLRGAPKLVARSAAARDEEVARRLWTVSETLTGVSFPESQLQNRTD